MGFLSSLTDGSVTSFRNTLERKKPQFIVRLLVFDYKWEGALKEYLLHSTPKPF